jgi:putative transposase
MKERRISETHILTILAEANDKRVGEVCRLQNISVPTFYSWKSRYVGIIGEELSQTRSHGQKCEQRSSDDQVRAAHRAIVAEHVRFGYRRAHAMARGNPRWLARKTVQRPWREEKLQVPT